MSQVMSILFEVESLRIDEPRNILALLSTNTRRTKVVELSSGTHRCAVNDVSAAGHLQFLPHGKPSRRTHALHAQVPGPSLCQLWSSMSLHCNLG